MKDEEIAAYLVIAFRHSLTIEEVLERMAWLRKNGNKVQYPSDYFIWLYMKENEDKV